MVNDVPMVGIDSESILPVVIPPRYSFAELQNFAYVR